MRGPDGRAVAPGVRAPADRANDECFECRERIYVASAERKLDADYLCTQCFMLALFRGVRGLWVNPDLADVARKLRLYDELLDEPAVMPAPMRRALALAGHRN